MYWSPNTPVDPIQYVIFRRLVCADTTVPTPPSVSIVSTVADFALTYVFIQTVKALLR